MNVFFSVKQDSTLLVGCMEGHCVEFDLPTGVQDYTKVTYHLERVELRVFRFSSVKSAIKQEIVRVAIEKAKEARKALRRQELEKMKELNPALDIDEEAYLGKIFCG